MQDSRSIRFHATRARAVATLTALAVAGVLLAACGSSSKSSSSSSTGTTAATTAPSAASGPGSGKPAVTLGDKNFAEENILGQLYAQALRAKGYNVTLKSEIGSTELIYKTLKAGQIDGYPEYTGVLLSAVAGQTKNPTSAAQAFAQAKAYVEKEGFTLLDTTPFFDTNVLITTRTQVNTNSRASATSSRSARRSSSEVRLNLPRARRGYRASKPNTEPTRRSYRCRSNCPTPRSKAAT
jgi:glycine betaine/choline ABC-type transport system substrate-binding protein